MQLIVYSIIAAFAASVSAQSLSSLPNCAQTCVGNSLSTTGCSVLDIACICKSNGWIAGLSCCIAKGCSAADQASTIQFADQLCAVAGVTLPSQASCAASLNTASSTSMAPPSSGSSAGIVVASTANMESMSGSMPSMSGVMSSMSGSMSAMSGSMSAMSGSMTMTSTGATGAATATPANTPSTTPTSASVSTSSTASGAGAARIAVQGMGAAGAAVAALAFL